jgi:hypothetical protein
MDPDAPWQGSQAAAARKAAEARTWPTLHGARTRSGCHRTAPARMAGRAAAAIACVAGKILGNYARIAKAKKEATDARAEAVRPAIASTLHMSATAAADDLNRRGITTASGKRWRAAQVIRICCRLRLTTTTAKSPRLPGGSEPRHG